MAKITFTKLGLKKNEDIKTIQICGQDIEVKQYLPIQEKLELIGRIIDNSANDNNFENPVHLEVYTNFEIIAAYTNITFTEKQREDISKTYDLLFGNKVINDILAWIPKGEYDIIANGVKDTVKATYAYKNSLLGILETISQDYGNLNLEASEIQQKIADPQNMEFLKSVLTKLG